MLKVEILTHLSAIMQILVPIKQVLAIELRLVLEPQQLLINLLCLEIHLLNRFGWHLTKVPAYMQQNTTL